MKTQADLVRLRHRLGQLWRAEPNPDRAAFILTAREELAKALTLGESRAWDERRQWYVNRATEALRKATTWQS